jgi:hypothetical protein
MVLVNDDYGYGEDSEGISMISIRNKLATWPTISIGAIGLSQIMLRGWYFFTTLISFT